MKIIGFTGLMGSGKSTAIALLSELQNQPVYLIKFAQPLYDMQEFIYNRITLAHKRDEFFVKDRKLLQWLGTEWGRDTIHKDLWTTIWLEEIKFAQENYPNCIIVSDDVRFDNEVQVLKQVGGHLIKIESNKNEERIDTKAGIAGHTSETGIDLNSVDFILENNGTLDDLKTALLTLNTKLLIW